MTSMLASFSSRKGDKMNGMDICKVFRAGREEWEELASKYFTTQHSREQQDAVLI